MRKVKPTKVKVYVAGTPRNRGRQTRQPLCPTPSSIKFNNKAANQISMSHLNLPQNVVSDLQAAAANSITGKTWQSYKTAERMLAKYLKSKKERLQLPVTENTVLGFVHWLAYEKNLKSSSISGYLAGIRKLHVIKGIEEPKLRTELVNMVLAGRQNLEATEKLKSATKERQPITLDLMLLLKAQLKTWDATNSDKVTAWCICTLLFHGAFRGGELLCKSTETFDPAVNLLRRDLLLTEDESPGKTIQIRLKFPKESKDKRATIIDVYETGTSICPVKAFIKWRNMTEGAALENPAFTWSSGKIVTTTTMNSIIKGRLDQFLPGHRISLHSFRTGTASMMANLGYSEKDIKAVGRWSSRAFENYIKLPRSKRISTLEKLKKKHW